MDIKRKILLAIVIFAMLPVAVFAVWIVVEMNKPPEYDWAVRLMSTPVGGGCSHYVSSDVPKDIPDSDLDGVSSTLYVSDTGYLAPWGITLTLTISHEYMGDLNVYLISPDSTESRVIHWIDGSDDGFIDTVLWDGAEVDLDDGSYPYTGLYLPEEPMAPVFNPGYQQFTGTSIQGTWTLKVVDDGYGDVGTLDDWEIDLCYQPAVTPTPETWCFRQFGAHPTDCANPVVTPLPPLEPFDTIEHHGEYFASVNVRYDAESYFCVYGDASVNWYYKTQSIPFPNDNCLVGAGAYWYATPVPTIIDYEWCYDYPTAPCPGTTPDRQWIIETG